MINTITSIAILVSTALTLYLINSFVKFKLKKKLSGNEQPISVIYFKGILFISAGLVFSELIETFQILTKILPSQIEGNNLILREVAYYCIFSSITLIIFTLIFWLSTVLFSLLSQGERIFWEVAHNNSNAVLLFAAILLAFTLALKTSITPLLDEFIPYPEIPLYR